MSKNSEQIAIAEAKLVNQTLDNSVFTDNDLETIIKLAWAARKRTSDEKSALFDHITHIVTEAAERSLQASESETL